MDDQTQAPIPLTPRVLSLPEVVHLASWPFSQDEFYVRQVQRSLRTTIPLRMERGGWIVAFGYDDPSLSSADQLIGFGIIELLTEYPHLTEGKHHFYVPLLGVRPGIKSKKYGSRILNHLTQFAAQQMQYYSDSVANHLFLDVYVANTRAIDCYTELGFVAIDKDHPISDPAEDGEPYIVMAKKL